MKGLAIVCATTGWLAGTFPRLRADELTPDVPKPQLACMGLAALEPIPDAVGDQVRGNRAICANFGAIGIPVGFVPAVRLVARLNWPYHGAMPDLATAILCQRLAVGDYAEPIPPGWREF